MLPNEFLVQAADAHGLLTGIVPVEKIHFHPELRAACEQNYCGNFGKNHMCPPLVGEVHDLIERARQYTSALVLSKVFPLEDSYDYEGMVAGGDAFHAITRTVRTQALALWPDMLMLGSGGCSYCEICTAKAGEPCASPADAMYSLEATGIHVASLAGQCGLKYINGQDTVTYFAAILLHEVV